MTASSIDDYYNKSGEFCQIGNNATITYSRNTSSGKSRLLRFEYTIGRHEVEEYLLDCFDRSLLQMKPGYKAEITCPGGTAY